jgi:hypothetical protein
MGRRLVEVRLESDFDWKNSRVLKMPGARAAQLCLVHVKTHYAADTRCLTL